MILVRNIRKRGKSIRWPLADGVVVQVAAGDVFAVHESDFETMPYLAAVLTILVREGLVVVEDTEVVPVLH